MFLLDIDSLVLSTVLKSGLTRNVALNSAMLNRQCGDERICKTLCDNYIEERMRNTY